MHLRNNETWRRHENLLKSLEFFILHCTAHAHIFILTKKQQAVDKKLQKIERENVKVEQQ